jgi:anti-anti-sigma factor
MSSGTATVTECDTDGTWLVALEGDHDLATRHQLEQQTRPIWPLCTIAVVDLTGVDFMDSGVVGWLVRIDHELDATGTSALSVVLGAADSVAARTFALMGAREWLVCFATIEEALATRT